MQTRKALETFSNGRIHKDSIGPLASHAERLVRSHEERQNSVKTEQNRHSVSSAMPALQAAKAKISSILGNQVLPDDAPIVSRFDAFSVIKDASKGDKKDQGLRKLALHLERLWHHEPLGTITSGALSALRNHYQHEHVSSHVAEVVDTVIPKVSFTSLPIANLVRIASQIKTQEDYNVAMAYNHLDGDGPKQVRARTFIRALLNRNADVEAGVNPEEEKANLEKTKEQFAEFNKISPRPLPGEPGGVPEVSPLTPAHKLSTISRVRGGDIATRVASRIKKIAEAASDTISGVSSIKNLSDKQSAEECTDKESAEKCDKGKITSEDLGVEGSGMMPVTAELEKLAADGDGFQAADPNKEGALDYYEPDELQHSVPAAIEYAKKYPQVAALVNKLGVDPNSPDAEALLINVLGNTPGAGSILQKIDQLVGQLAMKEPEEEAPLQVAAYRKLLAKLAAELDPDDPEYYEQMIGDVAEQEEMTTAKEESEEELEESKEFGLPTDIETSEEEEEESEGTEPKEVEDLPEPGLSVIGPDSEGDPLDEIADVTLERLEEAFPELMGGMPMAAAKKTKKTVMSPKVNPQQPDQVTVPPGVLKKKTKLTQKRPNLKAAVSFDNPMVDDRLDHLPISTPKLASISVDYVNKLIAPPDWWLGSLNELKQEVYSSLYAKAGKMPPALLENMKGKGEGKEEGKGKSPFGKGKEKGKKPPFGGKGKPPFGKDKEKGKSPFGKEKKAEIETMVLNGGTYKVANYSIDINDNMIAIHSKRGSKKYQLLDMNSAINDFIYLVSTDETNDSVFPPMFYIKEGIRVACLGCGSVNSYTMPKEAADLACDTCNSVIPADTVVAALQSKAAHEESVLVGYVPENQQSELGDVFAKAASVMSADVMDTIGNCAEAHAINVPEEKKAEAWDILVKAGFKHIALDVEDISIPEEAAPAIGGLGAEPTSAEPNIKDYKKIFEGQKAEKSDMVWEEAVAKYLPKVIDEIKAHELNFDEIVSSAKSIFGDGDTAGGLPAIMASLEKLAGDIPSTKVNQQQPDAEKIPKGVLGKDSDSEDPGDFKAGKPKTQVKPQGKFAPTKVDKESDSRDPGDFGAGKPKAQHPATDQSGTSLPDTNLGKDSETQTGKLTRKMDTVSKAAPKALRSM